MRYVIYKSGNETEKQHLFRAIHDTVIKVEQVQFLNIVHTLPSYANLLAAIIDDLSIEDISGTLAGHDTIVLVSKDAITAKSINKLIVDNADSNLLDM